MCKHAVVVEASRNAVVGVRSGIYSLNLPLEVQTAVLEDIARRENFYDAYLEGFEDGCAMCKRDAQLLETVVDTDRAQEEIDSLFAEGFLQSLSEDAEHWDNKNCSGCAPFKERLASSIAN